MATDHRISHRPDGIFLVLSHDEKHLLLHENGWFGHYNGARWQLWGSLPGQKTLYRFVRLDNLLAVA